jgi:hypothetical protein
MVQSTGAAAPGFLDLPRSALYLSRRNFAFRSEQLIIGKLTVVVESIAVEAAH